MAVTHLQDLKWNVHVLCLRVMQFTISSIHLTTGCPHCSFNKRKEMLEYLCLLQDWYWLSSGTSIYSSTCRQTRRFNCVRSVNIPLIFRRILWDRRECGGGGWGLQGEPTPPSPPLTVCHDWWLWATPKPPPQSPWWLIYFKQKGVHKRVCVCVLGGHAPQALMHFCCCTGEMHRDVKNRDFCQRWIGHSIQRTVQ